MTLVCTFPGPIVRVFHAPPAGDLGVFCPTNSRLLLTAMALHSADEIRQVANLARLTISDEDVERLQGQLSSILKYVERLNEVDTSQVEPMVHAIELTNVFRADEPAPSLPREAALANAPRSDGSYFLVPPIFDESE